MWFIINFRLSFIGIVVGVGLVLVFFACYISSTNTSVSNTNTSASSDEGSGVKEVRLSVDGGSFGLVSSTTNWSTTFYFVF
ncbi:MAG: hypothetical protein ACP5PT_03375 [Brevinematia bacterium]